MRRKTTKCFIKFKSFNLVVKRCEKGCYSGKFNALHSQFVFVSLWQLIRFPSDRRLSKSFFGCLLHPFMQSPTWVWPPNHSLSKSPGVRKPVLRTGSKQITNWQFSSNGQTLEVIFEWKSYLVTFNHIVDFPSTTWIPSKVDGLCWS